MYCRDTRPGHLVVKWGCSRVRFSLSDQNSSIHASYDCLRFVTIGSTCSRALLLSLQIVSELAQTADRLGSAGNGACLLHSCSKPPYDHRESKPRSSVSPSRTCISCRRQCHRPCWPCVCQSMPLAGPYELANQRKLSGCHQEIQLSCTNRRTRGLSP